MTVHYLAAGLAPRGPTKPRESIMRQYLKKAVAVGFLVFLGLWIIGVASGLTLQYPPAPPLPISMVTEPEYFWSRSNQAHNFKQLNLTETALPPLLDGPQVDQIRIFPTKAA